MDSEASQHLKCSTRARLPQAIVYREQRNPCRDGKVEI